MRRTRWKFHYYHLLLVCCPLLTDGFVSFSVDSRESLKKESKQNLTDKFFVNVSKQNVFANPKSFPSTKKKFKKKNLTINSPFFDNPRGSLDKAVCFHWKGSVRPVSETLCVCSERKLPSPVAHVVLRRRTFFLSFSFSILDQIRQINSSKSKLFIQTLSTSSTVSILPSHFSHVALSTWKFCST